MERMLKLKPLDKYNRNENDVDHGDQLIMQYSTSWRSKKFWKILLWFLCDTGVSCSLILRRVSPNRVKESRIEVRHRSQLDFKQNLARQLTAKEGLPGFLTG